MVHTIFCTIHEAARLPWHLGSQEMLRSDRLGVMKYVWEIGGEKPTLEKLVFLLQWLYHISYIICYKSLCLVTLFYNKPFQQQ